MTASLAPSWLVERPIAHRGLHRPGGAVENTLAAAEAAIAGGFAIECDVQLSADGEVFVFHDDALDRLTRGRGRFDEKGSAEIRALTLLGSDEAPPLLADFLAFVSGRVPVICELKSRFDGDFRLADQVTALLDAHDGPVGLKSFDHDLVAYLKLRRPRRRSGDPCPIGVVAEGAYDDPAWAFLPEAIREAWADFPAYDALRPDFLSFNVDHLPHKVPFLMKAFHGAPVMAWTVRTPGQAEAARKWADQVVFEADGAGVAP